MERSDEAFRFSGHSARKLLWRVGREPVDATINFSEVKVPRLIWRAAVSGSLRGYDEHALTRDITEVVVSDPTTVGNHFVDHQPPQICDCNACEQAPLFARRHIDWVGTAHGNDTKRRLAV